MNDLEIIDNILKTLFPLNRSLTGEGNRETLKIISQYLPINIFEIPSGKEVFDWTIPKEWCIRDAWIKNASGKNIIDFKESNLHVVSYSMPIHLKCKKEDLVTYLHYDKTIPDAIPYRTSYYKESWGFCLSYNDFVEKFESVEDEEYEVFIDSSLGNGSMSYGEILIKGKIDQEILISCYICHPSMANDSLSGVVVATLLSRHLLSVQDELIHSYRIIFIPETIGAIAYCAVNKLQMQKIERGFVLTTCGGPGSYGYKKSWDSKDFINEAVEKNFKKRNITYETYPFDINGSDERQYSSQTFKINCITITKDKYYEYPEYHTSLDNLNFVKPEALFETLNLYKDLIGEVDKDIILKNKKPDCEIMLRKYNLAQFLGGSCRPGSKLTEREIVMWLLFYCDGKTKLSQIAKLINAEMTNLNYVASQLIKDGVLEILEIRRSKKC